MAKAKTASAKKASSSKRKAKEPIVEIDGVELAENAASNEEPKSATPPEPPAVAEPAANVIWRGEKDPPQTVKIGRDTFELPSVETQRKGFYHDQAFRLVRQFKYKYFNPLS